MTREGDYALMSKRLSKAWSNYADKIDEHNKEHEREWKEEMRRRLDADVSKEWLDEWGELSEDEKVGVVNNAYIEKVLRPEYEAIVGFLGTAGKEYKKGNNEKGDIALMKAVTEE